MTTSTNQAVKKALKNQNMHYIEWEDSFGTSSGMGPWVEVDAGPEDTMCFSCGFVVKEDSQTITIAGHKACTGQFSGVMTIPKSAIRKRRIIRIKP